MENGQKSTLLALMTGISVLTIFGIEIVVFWTWKCETSLSVLAIVIGLQ